MIAFFARLFRRAKLELGWVPDHHICPDCGVAVISRFVENCMARCRSCGMNSCHQCASMRRHHCTQED